MEAFEDRVSRAFGALGGSMNRSGLHTPVDLSTSNGGANPRTSQLAEASSNSNSAQPVSDWLSSSSRGFGLVSKRKAEEALASSKEGDAGAPLWFVAQTVERKKRLWEEVESSDDEDFDKKQKQAGVAKDAGKGLLEGAEEDDETEGEMLSYVSLTEEPEDADEEGEWVRQMVGMDETLDNEEEEDGYDRLAAPTGTDPLGRMHTGTVGDAAEAFAKPVTFSRGKRDSRANREAACARLREDDEELHRGEGQPQSKDGKEPARGDGVTRKELDRGKVQPRGEEGGNLEREMVGDEHVGVVQSGDGLLRPDKNVSKESQVEQPTPMEEDGAQASVVEVRPLGETQSLVKAPGENKQEFTEAAFESGSADVRPVSVTGLNATKAGNGEGMASESSGLMQLEADSDVASGSGSLPDEQPLNFPNYRSGFMLRSNQAVPAPGVLKRPSEAAVDETRVPKRVRFTEEVTDRDEQKTREQEAAEKAGLFRGSQGDGADEGSLEGLKGRVTREARKSQQYVPPHRRGGFKRTANRVPEYVKHPDNYTMYTLDWSDEEDEKLNTGLGEERQNEGAFLDAVGRLKGEIGNVRFEELSAQGSGSTFGEAAEHRFGDARDREAGEASTSRVTGDGATLPVKFVQRKKDTSGTEANATLVNEEKAVEEDSRRVIKPQVTVAASLEELTELGMDVEEEGGEKKVVLVPGSGQQLDFKKKSSGQRPNKRYRVRSIDDDG